MTNNRNLHQMTAVDAVQNAPHPMPRHTVQEAADTLGMGQHALFAELRRRRILDHRNNPTWRYKDAGYFVEREHAYRHPVVGTRFYSRALVTARGLEWLRDLLNDCAEVQA